MTVSREVGAKVAGKRLYYGWVVVGTSTLLMVAHASVLNSFGVFFKPLATEFGWSRAATSGVQSILLVCMAIFGVAGGWLADRFTPARILALLGLIAGVGLILTSRVNAIWQIYLTFSLLVGIGICATYNVAFTTPARWFEERRGLVLGIVSSGIGLGTLAGVPGIARLIEAFGWSRAYLVLGVTLCVVMVGGAFFLRRPETADVRSALSSNRGTMRIDKAGEGASARTISLAAALRTWNLRLILCIFTLFTFCNQLILVHLVNYATDIGITPLVAATLVGVIGMSGMAGRLLMGFASDKIGSINVVIMSCSGVGVALAWLIFARELWMLYVIAVIYGFTFGAEVPQQVTLVGKFFGVSAAVMGMVAAGCCLGGALGAWVGGWVFDVTQSYQFAFMIGAAVIITALMATLLLRRRRST